jgi:hypothetical protein
MKQRWYWPIILPRSDFNKFIVSSSRTVSAENSNDSDTDICKLSRFTKQFGQMWPYSLHRYSCYAIHRINDTFGSTKSKRRFNLTLHLTRRHYSYLGTVIVASMLRLICICSRLLLWWDIPSSSPSAWSKLTDSHRLPGSLVRLSWAHHCRARIFHRDDLQCRKRDWRLLCCVEILFSISLKL